MITNGRKNLITKGVINELFDFYIFNWKKNFKSKNWFAFIPLPAQKPIYPPYVYIYLSRIKILALPHKQWGLQLRFQY